MKMACLGGHFPVLICEDTRKDHEKCIAFSWKPNGIFVWTKDKSHWDDNGWPPLDKLKHDVFPKPPKEKLTKTRVVDNFLVIGQAVYLNVSYRFLQVGHRNPFLRSWLHYWPWSHLLEAPQSLEELSFSPSPL
jgi:hypothetical protein